SMNYQLVIAGNQPNDSVGIKENPDEGKVRKKTISAQQYMLLPLWSCDSQGPTNTDDVADDSFKDKENQNDILLNAVSPTVNAVSSNIEIAGPSLFMDPLKYPVDSDMPELEDIVYSEDKKDVGVEADLSNLETNIPFSSILTTRVYKDHPFNEIIGDLNSAPQTRSMARVGHTQEEGIDYDEFFALVARIKAIRLFLAYASFMGFMVYQMDVKSAFLYGTIKEEVYVCQPLGFEDHDYPDKVYKATAKVKKVNDVDQLQALIDGKKCISAKRTAWNEFSCSMASSVICLATGRKFNFSKYIFDNMVRNMDSPSKFLMYPLFIQVFLDHQVDDMTIHNTKYTSPALTQKLFANMRRVRKGFLGVETPLFPSMLVQPQQQAEEGVELKKRVKMLERKKKSNTSGFKRLRKDTTPTPHDTPPQYQPSTPFDSPLQDQSTTPHKSSMPLLTTLMETCATLSQKVAELEDASKQKGGISAIDTDEDITLIDIETAKEVALDAESQGRTHQEKVNTASKGVSAVSAPELVTAAEPKIFDDEDVTMTMAQTLIKIKAKKARILDEQIASKLQDEEVQKAAARDTQERVDMERALELQRQYDDKEENIDWSAVTEQVKERHLDSIKKYQDLKKKPVSIAQARKNMIIYLKNMAGYKMKFFKGMTYDKEKFSSAEPSDDKEKALWVELKRLFELNPNDVPWKPQRYMHDPLTWKLYSDYRVHHVSSTRGHDIFMLTKKDHPLSNAVMILMLSGKLQVEEDNEMARDLVMKIFMEANKLRSRSLDKSS
nr:copia protein [Tanacetum cinerariifolium]